MSANQHDFIRGLREGAGLSLRGASELLALHGYPCTRGRVAQLETSSPLTSRAQLAYCRAFNLDDTLRLHLQRLAGEAAGCRSQVATEEAA